MPKPEKLEAVKEITGRFAAADAVLLTEYRGMTVGDMAELRSALRATDAEFKVLKNTLARIAVREVGLADLADLLEGPTAIAFCHGDAAAAAKALDEATRRFPVLVVKGGVLSGRIIGADQAIELGRLEPRDTQLAKMAMMMNTPTQQAVNVLAGLLRDLGSMLAQVTAAKESEPVQLPQYSEPGPEPVAQSAAEPPPPEDAPAAPQDSGSETSETADQGGDQEG